MNDANHLMNWGCEHFYFHITEDMPTYTSALIACENSHFFSLLAAWDISRGGMSATRRQKFHTDEVNQSLHIKFGSHGIPNANMINFTFLLVNFGKVLWSFANKFQQNSNASSREVYIPKILTVLLQIPLRLYLTFAAFCLMSVICKQRLEKYNYSDVQSALMTRFQTDFNSSV